MRRSSDLRRSRCIGSRRTVRVGRAFACALLGLLGARDAAAWGALGHRITAETAALLLEDDGTPLGSLLARHRFELGAYAFMPDMAFRHQDGVGALEGPLHFLSLDALGSSAEKLHAPWAEAAPVLIALESTGTEPVGRVPWRAQQLSDLAAEQWKDVARVEGSYQRGATSAGDSAHVFEALYFMGVMAHYTADAAVPHHATADANSFAKGQGGLHFYFEGDCVNALEPGLSGKVLARARRDRAEIARELGVAKGPVTAVFALLEDSASRLAEVERIDRADVLADEPLPPGTKAFAKRKPARAACTAFAAVLEERLAKAAVVTAELWKQTVPATIDWSASGALQFNDLHEARMPEWQERESPVQ
jgi:hypothetical protein